MKFANSLVIRMSAAERTFFDALDDHDAPAMWRALVKPCATKDAMELGTKLTVALITPILTVARGKGFDEVSLDATREDSV